MNKALKIGLVVLAIAVVAGLFVTLTPQGRQVIFTGFMFVNGPAGKFDPADAVPPPAYGDDRYWAALPGMDDPADLIPAGIGAPDIQGEAPADVFFIHPTGYLSGASWTSPMDPDSAAEENTRWMMAYQASAFNGCCNVYAPRYREATIFTYFKDADERKQVLDFAYQDVATAFEHYLTHYNQGRPFIIASHSQGSHHARRLLAEEIDGTPLRDRLVAAYTIGSVMIEYSPGYFAGLKEIRPCTTATETGCVIHWDTARDGSDGVERTAGSLCTNPLTWTVTDELADASLNLGALPITVQYNLSFDRDNTALGVTFDALDAPLPAQTWAQCRDDNLFVADQSRGPFAGAGMGASYHGLDYALFYMNIRENAEQRVEAWWAAHTPRDDEFETDTTTE